MGKAETLRIETGLASVSTPRRSSALPPHIANASKELEGKRVIVLDPDGNEGRIAAKASGVRQLGGSVQAVSDE